jgi:hypothetical protein
MTPTSVTLSSVGTSPAIQLDNWSGRAVMVGVVGSSGGFTGAFTIQVSLDLSSGSSISWINDSTLNAATSAAFATYFTAPCQVRLSSSALTSGSFILKANQGLA